jgi:lipopolysaccharide biosynthesis regulator YciM
MFPSETQGQKPASGKGRIYRWLAIGLLTAVFAYTGGVLALGFYFIHFRGFPDIRYRDVAIPTRWHRVNMAMGLHLIALAQEAFRREDFPAGLHLLRAGLKKAPSHRAARWALAQIHLDRGEYDSAQKLLLAGLAHHCLDPDYVAKLLQYLFHRQEDTVALMVCDELLSGTRPSTPATLALAAWGAASAKLLRGHYDTAHDYLILYRLDHTREGRLLQAQIEWERNYPDFALQYLRDLVRDFPGDEEIHLQLADYLKSAGLHDERRRLLMLLSLARPDLARPRIERLQDPELSQDPIKWADESRQLLRDFADNPTALLALGDYASATGQIDLVRKVRALLPALGASADAAALLLAEAKLTHGDFSGALKDLEALLRRDPPLPPDLITAAHGLQTVGKFALGETAAGAAKLQEFMLRPGLSMENLLAIHRRLIALGEWSAAHSALSKAVAIDPLNQAALTQLIDLELQSGALDEIPGRVQQLLKMRKPSPATLLAVRHELSRDYLLFSPEHRRTLLTLDQHLTRARQ